MILRVHDGYIPKKRSFNLPTRTKKTLFRKLFEATEMAMCENSNVEFDSKEKVALVRLKIIVFCKKETKAQIN